jgi:hypothetical protein
VRFKRLPRIRVHLTAHGRKPKRRYKVRAVVAEHHALSWEHRAPTFRATPANTCKQPAAELLGFFAVCVHRLSLYEIATKRFTTAGPYGLNTAVIATTQGLPAGGRGAAAAGVTVLIPAAMMAATRSAFMLHPFLRPVQVRPAKQNKPLIAVR